MQNVVIFQMKKYYVIYNGYSGDGDLQLIIQDDLRIINEVERAYQEVERIFIAEYLAAEMWLEKFNV